MRTTGSHFRRACGRSGNLFSAIICTSHFDVTEDKYREDGYQPPFEELPWKQESVAQEAPTS
jgi:hypothetical protein